LWQNYLKFGFVSMIMSTTFTTGPNAGKTTRQVAPPQISPINKQRATETKAEIAVYGQSGELSPEEYKIFHSTGMTEQQLNSLIKASGNQGKVTPLEIANVNDPMSAVHQMEAKTGKVFLPTGQYVDTATAQVIKENPRAQLQIERKAQGYYGEKGQFAQAKATRTQSEMALYQERQNQSFGSAVLAHRSSNLIMYNSRGWENGTYTETSNIGAEFQPEQKTKLTFQEGQASQARPLTPYQSAFEKTLGKQFDIVNLGANRYAYDFQQMKDRSPNPAARTIFAYAEHQTEFYGGLLKGLRYELQYKPANVGIAAIQGYAFGFTVKGIEILGSLGGTVLAAKTAAAAKAAPYILVGGYATSEYLKIKNLSWKEKGFEIGSQVIEVLSFGFGAKAGSEVVRIGQGMSQQAVRDIKYSRMQIKATGPVWENPIRVTAIPSRLEYKWTTQKTETTILTIKMKPQKGWFNPSTIEPRAALEDQRYLDVRVKQMQTQLTPKSYEPLASQMQAQYAANTESMFKFTRNENGRLLAPSFERQRSYVFKREYRPMSPEQAPPMQVRGMNLKPEPIQAKLTEWRKLVYEKGDTAIFGQGEKYNPKPTSSRPKAEVVANVLDIQPKFTELPKGKATRQQESILTTEKEKIYQTTKSKVFTAKAETETKTESISISKKASKNLMFALSSVTLSTQQPELDTLRFTKSKVAQLINKGILNMQQLQQPERMAQLDIFQFTKTGTTQRTERDIARIALLQPPSLRHNTDLFKMPESPTLPKVPEDILTPTPEQPPNILLLKLPEDNGNMFRVPKSHMNTKKEKYFYTPSMEGALYNLHGAMPKEAEIRTGAVLRPIWSRKARI